MGKEGVIVKDKLVLKVIFALLGIAAIVAAIFYVESRGWTIFMYCLAATFMVAPFVPVVMLGLNFGAAFVSLFVLFAGWLKIFGSASSTVMQISKPLFWSSLACLVIGLIVGAITEDNRVTVQPNSGNAQPNAKTEEDRKVATAPAMSKVRLGIDIFDVIRGAAIIGMVLSIVMGGYWVYFSISRATLYDFEYNEAKELYYKNITSFDDFEGDLCSYPDCTNVAKVRVWLDDVFPDIMPRGINLLTKMPNKAGYQLVSGNYTYTEKDKYTMYDTTIFLIPRGDGSIRIKTTTDKFTLTVNGKTTTSSKVSFEGHYCNDHADIARDIWYEEVEDVFIRKNIGYYFSEYGLWASLLLTPVVIGLAAAGYGVVCIFRPKKEHAEV